MVGWFLKSLRVRSQVYLIGLMILGFGGEAFGYIPEATYILDEVTKSHGKGVYSAEFELTFKSPLGSAILREKWIIENGSQMSVTMNHGGNFFAALYGDGIKTSLNEEGQKKSSNISSDFFESFLNVRSAPALGKMISSQFGVPAIHLQSRKMPKDIKDIDHISNPFIKLSRAEGLISYFFGVVSGSGDEAVAPGIWVDQDNFYIRKIKFSNGATVRFSQYGSVGRGLAYPKSKIVKYNDVEVTISQLRFDPIIENEKIRSGLTSSGFFAGKQNQVFKEAPLMESIKEFYLRFR